MRVIDAVGMESHGFSVDNMMDAAKQKVGVGAPDRGHALRQAIMACRKGGRVSVPGVYGGFVDKVPAWRLHAEGPSNGAPGRRMCSAIPATCLRRIEEGEIDHDLPDLALPAAGRTHRAATAISATDRTNGPRWS